MEIIRLKHIKNYRDLGGVKTVDGREIKPHMLIRGTALLAPGPISIAALKDCYNLKTIIDLRTIKERQEKPDVDIEGVEILHMPIINEATAGISHEKKVRSMESLLMMPSMTELYISMVTKDSLENLVKVLKFILTLPEEKFAVVFHCTAGKDRTGIVAALLLSFLGLFTLGYIKPESLYLTLGVVGVYEALEQLGCFKDKRVENNLEAYIDLLDLLNEGNKKASDEKTCTTFNLEQVPAENAAVKLATIDRELGRHNYKLLSNQWLPLSYDTDIFSRLEVAGALDTAMSGGAIVHISAGNTLDETSMMNLIDYASKTENVYFAVNYMFSCCRDCGTISHSASTTVCPKCGGDKLDQFTRVVGFITPLDTWSTPRREEKRVQLDLTMRQYAVGKAS